jgi:uncharacterized protein (TIGR00288 family)
MDAEGDGTDRDSGTAGDAGPEVGGERGPDPDAKATVDPETDPVTDPEADPVPDPNPSGIGGFHVDRTVGVALFVDGPNVLRDEFDVDLDDVREAAGEEGPLVTTRLYLDEHATPGLIQAAEARGFEVVITSGDVDVKLAVDATRFAAEGRMTTLAIASRDTDFKPVLETANGYGVRTVAIAPGEFGRSDALRNSATDSVTLDGDV